MNVKQIFELGVKIGALADPRKPSGVKKYLARIQKEYQDLKPEDKAFFDKDSLSNPYPDSGIHVDDGKTQVKRIVAGIDINATEILLASQLSERGKKIDLAIAHHPEGKPLAKLHEVMEMSADIFVGLGVPVHLAEKILEERTREVERGFHPLNHYQAIQIAQLLGVNFINTHTITDNLVNKFINDLISKKKPETMGELMKLLLDIPEYREARRLGFGPLLAAGSPKNRIGKCVVEMTGGTEPSAKVYQEFSRSGVSTVVAMHMRKETLEKSNEMQMNVIIAGHISSDSLGMNLFLDELEKKGIEIVPCGGLIRVSRVKGAKKK